jgi:hypothetical protein
LWKVIDRTTRAREYSKKENFFLDKGGAWVYHRKEVGGWGSKWAEVEK